MEPNLSQSEVDEIVVTSFLRAFDSASKSEEAPAFVPVDQAQSNFRVQIGPIAVASTPSTHRTIANVKLIPYQSSPIFHGASGADFSRIGSFAGRHLQAFYGNSSVPRSLSNEYYQRGRVDDFATPLSTIELQLPVEMQTFNHNPVTFYNNFASQEMEADTDQSGERISEEDEMPAGTLKPVKSQKRAGGAAVDREIPISCKRCRTRIGVARVSGIADQFAKPFVCDLVCAECSSLADQPTVPPMRGKAKSSNAASRSVSEKLECRVCRVFIGNGGIRMVVAGGSQTSMVWIAPEFDAEYVCEYCFRQFKYCSPCSNGTTGAKTERFRPRQMFQNNRGTCFLPHIRAGKFSDTIFVSYRLPLPGEPISLPNLMPRTVVGSFKDGEQIPYSGPTQEAAMQMAQDTATHSRHFLYHYFDGSTMQDYALMCTWELLNQSASDLATEISRFVRGLPSLRPLPPGTRLRRYIGIAFAPKQHAKNKAESRVVRSPPQNYRNDFDFNTNHAGNYQITGMSLATWNIDAGAFIQERVTYLGSTNPVLNKVLHRLITINRQRVESEIVAEGLTFPRHQFSSVVRMHRKAHMAKLFNAMLQIGLQPLETYCAANGLDLDQMKRASDCGDVYLFEEKFETFAKAWDWKMY